MRSRIIFLMGFIFAFAISAVAQARSVTNASLEAYKQERVKNEREYRDNYERLGLPSPEELGRRSEQAAKEMAELSDKLRAEDLERERIASRRFRPLAYSQPILVGSSDTIYGYSWAGRRHYFLPRRANYSQSGYFAGGRYWPTGSATSARPMIGRGRH